MRRRLNIKIKNFDAKLRFALLASLRSAIFELISNNQKIGNFSQRELKSSFSQFGSEWLARELNRLV